MKKLKQLLAICMAPQKINRFGDFTSTQTLRLDFRGASLRTVLDYVSKSAGFIIAVHSTAAMNEKVDIFHHQPLGVDEALNLLKEVLHKQGCTLIQNGHRLAIMRTEDAKKSYIPIRLARNHAAIFKEPVSSRRLFSPATSSWAN